MSNIPIPSAGTWVYSCMVGANSYRILDSTPHWLEEGINDSYRLSHSHQYCTVAEYVGRNPQWLVLFQPPEDNPSRQQRLFDGLEHLQMSDLKKEGFCWPYDIIWNGDVCGYIIHPIDTERYRPIRSYQLDPTAARWDYATDVFRLVDALHKEGLILNGLNRDMLRVDTLSERVCIWPDEWLEDLQDAQRRPHRHGFLSPPNALFKKDMTMFGRNADLFSAVVLAFQLLYFTHPFVGGAFWSLSRDEYKAQYHSHPDYIFDPAGHNALGSLDYERAILQLWEQADPLLQTQFNNFFLYALYGVAKGNISGLLDPAEWIRLLQLDKERHADLAMPDFPFDMLLAYQV